MIASGSIDGTVRLWDVDSGKVVTKWTGHTAPVKSVCWSPDGERVVSGASDETIKVWNVRSAKPILGLNPAKTGQSVHAVSYSPKAKKFATAGSNIKIWDAKTGKLLSTIGNAVAACSLAWTSDDKKLIAGYMVGSIRIFDTATWTQIAFLDGHGGPVYGIALSRNDRLLVSASGDQKARLWNLDTKFLVGPPLQHEHIVTSAAFSDDGTLLSTGCADENAYVWDVYAILQATGLEDLLPHDAPSLKVELKQNVYASSHGSSQDIEDKSFLEANATGSSNSLGDADELPPGFFDDMEVNAHSSARPGTHPTFPAFLDRFPSFLRRSSPNEAIENSESRPRVLLSRLSSFLRSPRNIDGISELPQPSMFARLSPQVLLGHLALLLPHSRLHTNEITEPQQPQTSSRSRSGGFFGRLSSHFRSPNADETSELHLWTRQTTSSSCSPQVVEVVAQRDKQALYVSPPRETASDKAKRIKNPTRGVRIVLFLCCVSPGTDDTHGST
jgi:hypothetical protein